MLWTQSSILYFFTSWPMVFGTERVGTVPVSPPRNQGTAQLSTIGMVKTVTRLVSAVSTTARAALPRPTKVSALEVVPAGQSETMNRPSAICGGSRNSVPATRPSKGRTNR